MKLNRVTSLARHEGLAHESLRATKQGPGCAVGTKVGTADTVFDLVTSNIGNCSSSNINNEVHISSFSIGQTLSPSSLSLWNTVDEINSRLSEILKQSLHIHPALFSSLLASQCSMLLLGMWAVCLASAEETTFPQCQTCLSSAEETPYPQCQTSSSTHEKLVCVHMRSETHFDLFLVFNDSYLEL